MSINIRNAKVKDAEALAKIHIDSWKAAYKGLVPEEYLDKLDYKKRAERFKISLKQNSEDNFVVESNDLIVGFVTFGNCRDDDLDTNIIGEIWGIYLDPEYWRMGIGTKLFQFAENILLKRGFKTIVLWVFAKNIDSRKFYEAMEFTADGAAKILNIGKALNAIRYRKELLSR